MKNNMWRGLTLIFIFIALGLLAQGWLNSWRWDVTSDRIHRLSPGSEALVKKLPKNLELKLFYTPSLSAVDSAFDQALQKTIALLSAYQRAGNKIDWRIVQVSPFSPEEDQALAQGLEPLPLPQGGNAYMGLTAKLGNKRALLPFLDPARLDLLEYDISRLIAEAAQDKPATIGVISSLPLESDYFSAQSRVGGEPQGWLVWSAMRQLFNLRALPPTATLIPDDVDVLMIVHPQQLPPALLYAIDQFMLQKGRALIFLDPNSEAITARQAANPAAPASSSHLEILLKAWGVEFDPAHIVGDQKLALRVESHDTPKPVRGDYLGWLNLGKDNLSNDDPVTAQLQQIILASAGYLKGQDLIPLIVTSGRAGLIEVEKIKFAPDIAQLAQDFKPSGEAYVLAARRRGILNSAFPSQPPPGAASANNLSAGKEAAEIIFVADSDLLEDRFTARKQSINGREEFLPLSDNVDFVLNALESLAGRPELLELRRRKVSTPRFTKLLALQEQALQEGKAHELALQQKLNQAYQNLRNNAAPKEILAQARQDVLATRQELRALQRQLNERTEGRLKAVMLFTLLVWPALVIITGIGIRRWWQKKL
ncbi:MAG: Gldg family protein [Dongiaceae bacterium]